MLIVIFSGVGLDVLWQRLEMLAHGVGELLLQVMVFGVGFGADDSGLEQVENHVLVNNVLDAFRAFTCLKVLCSLSRIIMFVISNPAFRTASLIDLEHSSVPVVELDRAHRPGFRTRNIFWNAACISAA